jgi:hypothetical protein
MSKTAEGPPDVLMEVATLCSSITADPTKDIEMRFDRLYKLCKTKELGVRRKAILSAGVVLVGILPDYSVGKHSAKDRLSKEVSARRGHEQILLTFTRRFLQFSEMMTFGRDNPMGIRTATATCMCELFKQKRSFDTWDHLVIVMVRLSNCPAVELRALASKAIAAVFETDRLRRRRKILAQVAVRRRGSVTVCCR